MEDSTILQLPYIAASQAQKHVTHNEALHKLDILVQLSVQGRGLNAPPADYPLAARYIVGSNPTGIWQGKAGQIAYLDNNDWHFLPPQQGWRCWVMEDEKLLAYNGTAWVATGDTGTGGTGGGLSNPVPLVGINTVADATNKLSVKSDAVLLSHDDVTPGSGDIQVKVNKAAASDTASHLFQTGFSGRAETGLTGDDDFHIKVSFDGAAWKEAITIDKTSGEVGLPFTPVTRNSLFNLFGDAGRFAGSPETKSIAVGAYTAASYLTPYNGAAFSGYAKFIHNNSTYGGTGLALNAEVDALVSSFKTAATYKLYGPEFWVQKVIMGSGTSGARTTNGVTRYLSMTNLAAAIWTKSSWGIHLRSLTGSISVHTHASYRLYLNGALQTSDFVISPADGWKQIIFVGVAEPGSDYEYKSVLFSYYLAPGTTMLHALPFLTPSQITLKQGDLIGRVPSLGVWT